MPGGAGRTRDRRRHGRGPSTGAAHPSRASQLAASRRGRLDDGRGGAARLGLRWCAPGRRPAARARLAAPGRHHRPRARREGAGLRPVPPRAPGRRAGIGRRAHDADREHEVGRRDAGEHRRRVGRVAEPARARSRGTERSGRRRVGTREERERTGPRTRARDARGPARRPARECARTCPTARPERPRPAARSRPAPRSRPAVTAARPVSGRPSTSRPARSGIGRRERCVAASLGQGGRPPLVSA